MSRAFKNSSPSPLRFFRRVCAPEAQEPKASPQPQRGGNLEHIGLREKNS